MRRPIRFLGILTAGLLLTAILLVVLALTVEVAIPLDSQRERIARVMSDALGAPVGITGPLKAFSGPRAGIEVAQLRIGAGPAGNEGGSVEVGRLVVRLHLMPLLSRTIRVSDLSVEEVLLCIPETASSAPAQKALQARHAQRWQLQAVERLTLARISVTRGAPCTPDRALAQLMLLEGAAPANAPLTVTARGRVGDETVSAALRGPTLAGMLARAPKQAFEATADIAGAKVAANGQLNFAEISGEADVELETAQFVRIIRPLGAPFKDFGPLRVRAHIAATGSEAKVRVHEAALDLGKATADATFAWAGPHPSLLLDASTEQFDAVALGEWLAKAIDRTRLKPGRLTRLTIAGLRASEGRVRIGIGELGAGRVELLKVALDGTWALGQARASINGLVGKAPVAGTLQADLRKDELVFSGAANLQHLALPPKSPVKGEVKTIDVKFDVRGTLGERLIQRLRASVSARQAALGIPDGRGKILPLNVEHVVAQVQQRDTLTLTGRGTLSGERWQVHFEGADAAALWQRRPWSLRASAEVGPLAIKAGGKLAVLEGRVDTSVDFTARARRLGPLAHGNAGLARLALEAGGRVSIESRAWSVELASLRLGGSRGRAAASGSLPLALRPMKIDVDLDALDLNELAGAAKQINALPRQLTLPDADLNARAKRVILPRRVAEGAEIRAAARNGRLNVSRFDVELDGAHIGGELGVDLTGAAPTIHATAKATGITEAHFGAALAAHGIRLQLGEIGLTASSSGNRIRDLAENASVDIGLRGGAFSFPGGDKKRMHSGTVASARLSVTQQQPARLRMEAEIGKLPVSLEASSAPLVRLLQPADAPLALKARVAGIDVELEGHLPGPRLPDNPLTVKIRAEKLSQLDAFTTHDLPSTGPLELDLSLRGLSGRDPSAHFAASLGESRLAGQLARRVTAGRTRWEGELRGPRLRLEDLGSAEWMAEREEPTAKKKNPGAPDKPDAAARRQRAQILYEGIRDAVTRVDVRLRAAIDSIRSGPEDLGRFGADLVLEAGRLRLEEISLAGAQGKLFVSVDADYAADDRPFRLDIALERFPYGRLVHSLNPALDATGELSAQLSLTGRGTLAEMAPSLNGRAGVIVFPAATPGLRLIELWGGGLLQNLALALDRSKDSRINCAVATFQIDQGVLKSQALMLDSTRVRAAGELKVDLADGALAGLIVPKPKRAALFTKKVPITIGGTLRDPVVAVAPASGLRTAARYYYFYFAFLFDSVTGEKLAADGSPDCIAAYRKLTGDAPR